MQKLPLAVLGSLALPLVATPAGAWTAELTRVDGVLGSQVVYQVQGDPFEVYALVPSLTTGPTPLALVDPLDPRSLGVGIDLLALLKVGTLDGAGQASAAYALPADPTLHGIPFYAQAITIPGASLLVDEITNRTSFVLGLPGDSTFTVTGQLAEIDGHTATTLGDGRVLIAGGAGDDGLGGTEFHDFHLFDPQTQGFSLATGTMQHGRTAHTATPLADGRVLVVGGVDESNTVRATADLWDPATGLATPAGSMGSPRTLHTATRLSDGRVLVAGGLSAFDEADPVGSILSAQATTEIYDPSTDAWSPAASLPKPRVAHASSPLSNGGVLVSGGIEITSIIFVPVPDFSADCRRYNPATNAWLSAGAMPERRALHAQLALSNGLVLASGGADGDLIAQSFFARSETATYDPGTNAWTPRAPLGTARASGTLLETGGRVVHVGGIADVDPATLSGTPADEIETTDLAVSGWTSPGTTILPRELAVSVLVDGGLRVLTTGTGDDGMPGAPDLTAEIFIP